MTRFDLPKPEWDAMTDEEQDAFRLSCAGIILGTPSTNEILDDTGNVTTDATVVHWNHPRIRVNNLIELDVAKDNLSEIVKPHVVIEERKHFDRAEILARLASAAEGRKEKFRQEVEKDEGVSLEILRGRAKAAPVGKFENRRRLDAAPVGVDNERRRGLEGPRP